MRLDNVTLTLPELNHLTDLLLENERNGEYSGPERAYWKRHKQIVEKLEAAAMVLLRSKAHAKQ